MVLAKCALLSCTADAISRPDRSAIQVQNRIVLIKFYMAFCSTLKSIKQLMLKNLVDDFKIGYRRKLIVVNEVSKLNNYFCIYFCKDIVFVGASYKHNIWNKYTF